MKKWGRLSEPGSVLEYVSVNEIEAVSDKMETL